MSRQTASAAPQGRAVGAVQDEPAPQDRQVGARRSATSRPARARLGGDRDPVQVMETNRDDLVVVMAGCAARMDRFFSATPGFRSRIAHHIDFPD